MGKTLRGNDDIEIPLQEFQETKLIDADGHEIYEFEMEEGDQLVFSVDAEDFVDLVVCEEEDFETWDAGEVEDEERPLPDGYWHRTAVLECNEYKFIAPHEGCFVLLVLIGTINQQRLLWMQQYGQRKNDYLIYLHVLAMKNPLCWSLRFSQPQFRLHRLQLPHWTSSESDRRRCHDLSFAKAGGRSNY